MGFLNIVSVIGFLIYGCTLVNGRAAIPAVERDPDYWRSVARAELKTALERKLNTNVAKNVILFMGDGMSFTTIVSSRIWKGQQKNKPGEGEKLVFETFPNVGLAKPYSVDAQISDSAVTATAFLCGVKSIDGTLGMTPRVTRGHCPSAANNNLTCIGERFLEAKKSVGMVTTARLTHASPGALYSKSVDRSWEADSNLPANAVGVCEDIGSQLVTSASRDFKVVMGGGRQNLFPRSMPDPETSKPNLRNDGRNIVDEWVTHKTAQGKKVHYVWNQTAFDAVDPKTTDYLIGAFSHSHMNYEGQRANDVAGEPSLADMTAKAIDILEKDDKGYFLFVEGARIDHAHHEGTNRLALEDTVALDEAVQRALYKVDLDDTLVIVTSDHSHADAMVSYNRRGNPILGLVDWNDAKSGDGLSDVDFKPYTTMMYANGPGFNWTSPVRVNLTDVNTTSQTFHQPSAVPTKYATHEGADVPIYATGPMAHLFHTTHEQNYIYNAMAYAACVGDDKSHCDKDKDDNKKDDKPTCPPPARVNAVDCVQTSPCLMLIVVLALSMSVLGSQWD